MKRTVSALMAACALTLSLAVQSFAASRDLTLTGRLARTVEAGGWLVVTEGGEKYLILNARRFSGESWFREGARVIAEGETKEDAVSIHMEGTPFEARTLRPQRTQTAGDNGGSGDGAQARPITDGRAAGLTRVSVTGEALVQSQPDTAVLSLAVVTQNASASEAQAENASRTDAVVRAVRAAAGAGAEVKTGGYSLQPQYVYKQNESPTITGYIARNAVVVTMSDLTRVGAVIDAASRAGANSVDSLAFTLRRDEAARRRALSEATREAFGKAQTVAEALGGRVARVYEVEEGGAFVRPPVPIYAETRAMAAAGSAAQTPIEPGALDIRAQVRLVAEIETRQ
ncbi:MAG TPA: SIMPL domain-containing protein [Pyrinomonadaceae bacterium]|nr:SIMPL domain-containing protein [Pyrinomonadaceae bacterium]